MYQRDFSGIGYQKLSKHPKTYLTNFQKHIVTQKPTEHMYEKEN